MNLAYVAPAIGVLVLIGIIIYAFKKAQILPTHQGNSPVLRADPEAIATRIGVIADNLMREAENAKALAAEARGERK